MQDRFRYPIGRFEPPSILSTEERAQHIDHIEALPERLRSVVSGLADAQLDTPYRTNGWTVRQVVHHLADSHMNAYIRFRLAVTEDAPRIKPYDEGRWAELDDARNAPIDVSLDLLTALHGRWGRFLRSLEDGEWRGSYEHPEGGPTPLTTAVALYAWHGRHHVAHITSLRERKGW